MPGLCCGGDVGQREPGLRKQRWKSRTDRGIATLRREKRAVGRQKRAPIVVGGRQQSEGVAMVILDGQVPAGREGAHQLSNVRERIWQEQEHPAREDQIVGAGGKRSIEQVRLPHLPDPEATRSRLRRELGLPEGAFAASLDADSEGVEGKFYVWSLPEVTEALGENAALFVQHYDVTEGGNFEGHNILNRLNSLPRSADDEIGRAHV